MRTLSLGQGLKVEEETHVCKVFDKLVMCEGIYYTSTYTYHDVNVDEEDAAVKYWPKQCIHINGICGRGGSKVKFRMSVLKHWEKNPAADGLIIEVELNFGVQLFGLTFC